MWTAPASRQAPSAALFAGIGSSWPRYPGTFARSSPSGAPCGFAQPPRISRPKARPQQRSLEPGAVGRSSQPHGVYRCSRSSCPRRGWLLVCRRLAGHVNRMSSCRRRRRMLVPSPCSGPGTPQSRLCRRRAGEPVTACAACRMTRDRHRHGVCWLIGYVEVLMEAIRVYASLGSSHKVLVSQFALK